MKRNIGFLSSSSKPEGNFERTSAASPAGGAKEQDKADESFFTSGEVWEDGTITVVIPPELRKFTIISRSDGMVSFRFFTR